MTFSFDNFLEIAKKIFPFFNENQSEKIMKKVTQLYQAISKNDITKVNNLLTTSQGQKSLNYIYDSNVTPPTYSLKFQHTALSHACEKGNVKILDSLLSTSNIDLNWKSLYSGNSALIEAAFSGHYDCLERLIKEKNIDLHIINKKGENVIAALIQSPPNELLQELELIKKLVKEGVSLYLDNIDMFVLAINNQKEQVLDFLFTQNLQYDHNYLLFASLKNGEKNSDINRKLVDYGLRFDSDFLNTSHIQAQIKTLNINNVLDELNDYISIKEEKFYLENLTSKSSNTMVSSQDNKKKNKI